MGKDNKKLIYFSIICLVIVIIIITGTYAYFTAKRTVDNAFVGATETNSFGLSVKKISTIDDNGLIPMDDEYAPYAAKNMCAGGYGFAVCQIYKITVNNTGTTDIYLDGYLTLNIKTEDEMRFTRLYYDGDNYCIDEKCSNDIDINNIKPGIAVNTDGKYNRIDDFNALLIKSEKENEGDLIKAGVSKDYYVMIWVHNEDREQNDLQGMEKFFNGSVTFISSQGNEITAVFE